MIQIQRYKKSSPNTVFENLNLDESKFENKKQRSSIRALDSSKNKTLM